MDNTSTGNKKFYSTTNNFIRIKDENSNENHINKYYIAQFTNQKTTEKTTVDQINPDQSPKIQSGKYRKNQGI